MHSALAALLLGLCAWLAATPGRAETLRFSFPLEGHTRSYNLAKPRPSQAPRPLVLVLHGAGGDAFSMAFTGWEAAGQRADWLVAFPEALEGMWDTGGGKISRRFAYRRDDAAYLAAVIDDIARRYRVDPQRIFATGFSRGAQASFLAACRLPGRIRAVAPVAMAMPVHLAPECRSGPPLGVLMITGTEDPFVPAQTGPVRIGIRTRDTMLSPQDTARHWRARNGCANAPASIQRIDAIPDDGTTLTRTTWPACTRAPIINTRINGGGHDWPSATRRSLFRTPNREIDATAAAMAFFRSFE